MLWRINSNMSFKCSVLTGVRQTNGRARLKQLMIKWLLLAGSLNESFKKIRENQTHLLYEPEAVWTALCALKSVKLLIAYSYGTKSTLKCYPKLFLHWYLLQRNITWLHLMILYGSHQERRTDTDYKMDKPRIRAERINVQHERRKIKMGQRKRNPKGKTLG